MPGRAITTGNGQPIVQGSSFHRKSISFVNNTATAKFFGRCYFYNPTLPTTTDAEFIIGPGVAREFDTTNASQEFLDSAFYWTSDTATQTIFYGES